MTGKYSPILYQFDRVELVYWETQAQLRHSTYSKKRSFKKPNTKFTNYQLES